MTSEIARASASSRSRSRRRPKALSLGILAALVAGGCSSFVEVPVETPLQSKLDVSSFRRVLIAGFATDLVDADVDLSSETARLLQNQLRNTARLQVIEPDRPPLQDALEKIQGKMGEGTGKLSKGDRDQYKLEVDKVLQDGDFWRKVGEEYQQPLIVTGKLGFEAQNRSGFQPEERVVRDSRNRPQLVRGNRYTERKGYSLSADFYFVDGRTGQTLHKEKFTEEVLYSEDQKTSPLSSYFELMDRLLPNFLGVISPQRIRGTRVLLK
jgi:hypothetical protein